MNIFSFNELNNDGGYHMITVGLGGDEYSTGHHQGVIFYAK
jgi:hypothetical protein